MLLINILNRRSDIMYRMLRFSLVAAVILAVGLPSAFAANPEKKSKMSNPSEEAVRDIPMSSSNRVLAQVAVKYNIGQKSYQTSCDDINPEAGTIIQHDWIGPTGYDEQQIGSIGRMISVTSGGHRHFSWTYCDEEYGPSLRWVDNNCKNPAGYYIGYNHADGGDTKAGYSNQTHLHDEISVIAYHHDAGFPATWYSMLTIDNDVCGGFFTRHWDIPDWIQGNTSGEEGRWPKAEVFYDAVEDLDYIHIVVTEGVLDYVPVMVGYERCFISPTDPDSLYCQSYVNGSTVIYAMDYNTSGPGSFAPISHLDSSCNSTSIVAVSPVSRRMGVVYLKPADPAGSCDYYCDVCFTESMDNGDDWIDGSNWPPASWNITNYGTVGSERAYVDVAACYDFEDSLHVVWNAHYFDPEEQTLFTIANLYHWSKEAGISLIASGYPDVLTPLGKGNNPHYLEGFRGDTNPGIWNGTVCKPSIAAMDPVYHPDSVYLYCIWTQFDPGDTSTGGFGNGDIYGAGSSCGGKFWDGSFNLTNTKTPGCSPGECVSEHWGSLALNLNERNLHIQYICDRDAGAAVQSEGDWTDNQVMYLELEAWQPEVSIMCGDANDNGAVEAGDVVYLISYLFRSGPAPEPMCVGDANLSGAVEAGDVVYLISYLFRGAPAPSPDCCAKLATAMKMR
jgi:hypothetical protein